LGLKPWPPERGGIGGKGLKVGLEKLIKIIKRVFSLKEGEFLRKFF